MMQFFVSISLRSVAQQEYPTLSNCTVTYKLSCNSTQRSTRVNQHQSNVTLRPQRRYHLEVFQGDNQLRGPVKFISFRMITLSVITHTNGQNHYNYDSPGNIRYLIHCRKRGQITHKS